MSQAVDLVVVLNVLDVQPSPQGDLDRIRFLATYEKSRAHFETDIFDPSASSLEDRYARGSWRAARWNSRSLLEVS